jgi:hypothetical protein
VTNGGATPSAGTVSAFSVFLYTLDSYSITSSIIALNLFAPDSVIAAITPLISNAGNNPWTNNNFVLGDLNVNGLIGNGATKYLDTGIIPGTAFTATAAGMFAYISFNNVAFNGVELQSFVSTAVCSQLDAFSGPLVYCAYNQTVGQGLVSFTTSGFTGYFSGQRTAANAIALYGASSSLAHTALATGTGAGGTAPAISTYCLAGNFIGTAVNFSANRLSCAGFSKGLSSTQDGHLYDAIQACRTTLGGGFV